MIKIAKVYFIQLNSIANDIPLYFIIFETRHVVISYCHITAYALSVLMVQTARFETLFVGYCGSFLRSHFKLTVVFLDR